MVRSVMTGPPCALWLAPGSGPRSSGTLFGAAAPDRRTMAELKLLPFAATCNGHCYAEYRERERLAGLFQKRFTDMMSCGDVITSAHHVYQLFIRSASLWMCVFFLLVNACMA